MNEPIGWPALGQLRKSRDDLELRCQFIGGSDANVLLSGNAERVRDLWLEKRKEKAPDDLSSSLPVQLGCWTEAFNRQWFEVLSGHRVISLGEVVVCPVHEWRRATLDGIVGDGSAIWEAKHTSAFASPDDVLERYMPQLQHNMAVTGHQQASLSVIFGNHKFEIFEIAADWLYQSELLKAEQHFWHCVKTGMEPVAVAPPTTPRPIGSREISFEGNNAWASAAFEWIEHRAAAKAHSAATKTIKDLIEDDVTRAFGHGIEAKRSKSAPSPSVSLPSECAERLCRHPLRVGRAR